MCRCLVASQGSDKDRQKLFPNVTTAVDWTTSALMARFESNQKLTPMEFSLTLLAITGKHRGRVLPAGFYVAFVSVDSWSNTRFQFLARIQLVCLRTRQEGGCLRIRSKLAFVSRLGANFLQTTHNEGPISIYSDIIAVGENHFVSITNQVYTPFPFFIFFLVNLVRQFIICWKPDACLWKVLLLLFYPFLRLFCKLAVGLFDILAQV